MINEKIVPMSPCGFRFPTETEMAVDETLKLCGISGEDASMIAIEVMKKLGKSNEIPACCRGDRDAQTTVDAVEVVRCKNCKHRFNGEHHDNCCDVLMEKVKWTFEVTVEPDWFCADGERKTYETD